MGDNPWYQGNDEVGDGDGDPMLDVGVLLDDGVLWCAKIPASDPATAYYTPENPPVERPIWEDFDRQMGQPKDCLCAHVELDNFLKDYSDTTLEVLTTHQIAWEQQEKLGQGPLTFRNKLWTKAEQRCLDLADDQWPDRDDEPMDNCQTAIDKNESGGVTPIERSENEPCTTALIYGEGDEMLSLPEDHWSDYVTLSQVINYNTGTDSYSIDGGFFNMMLLNPAWLILDGTYIDLDSGQSFFQFYNITSGTVLHALGIESDDVPQTLNDIDISTPMGAVEAWEQLRSDTHFELVVLRGMNVVTLEYGIIYMQ